MFGRISLFSLLAASACVVPLLDPPATEDTGPAIVDSQETGETGDSQKPEDSDILVDTSWGTDTDSTGNTNPGNTGPVAGCHPYDPLAQAGWKRTYTLQTNGKQGQETHQGLGLTASLPTGAGFFPAKIWKSTNVYGFVVSQKVAGNARPDVTYYNDCISGSLGDQATTVGYMVANPTKPAKATYVAYTNNTGVYLPGAQAFSSILGYSAHPVVKARVANAEYGFAPGCPNGYCWHYTNYILSNDMTISAEGAEVISVGPLQNVTAQKITVISHMSVKMASSGNPFADLFAQAFAPMTDLFTTGNGYQQGATKGALDAQITRWYVQGIGLVKEQTEDINNQGTITYLKTLKSCSGLQGC